MKIKQLKGEIQYPKREKEKVDKLTWQKREMKEEKKEKRVTRNTQVLCFYTFNTVRKILTRRFQSHLERLSNEVVTSQEFCSGLI